MDEKITVEAKRRKKGTRVMQTLKDLGFTHVKENGPDIVAEKIAGEELSGKANLDYRVTFGEKTIEFSYALRHNESKRKRLLRLFPIFINTALLAEDDYDIRVSSLFKQVNTFITELGQVVDKDAFDLAAQKEELGAKYADMSKKYSELVRSSEENARLLLECERRRDELEGRVRSLEKMSDEALKEELYKWIKLHEGSLELTEFCEAYRLPIARAEEGLNMLVREGYIKKRSD